MRQCCEEQAFSYMGFYFYPHYSKQCLLYAERGKLHACINQITKPMELRLPWEADSCSDSQEIPRLSHNLKTHHSVHKSPSLVSILSQINPTHTILPHFIHLETILPFTCRPPKWTLSYRFSDKLMYALLIYPVCATCPSHPPSFNHRNNI